VRPRGDRAYWAGVIRGDSSSTLWTSLHAFDDMPKTVDLENHTAQYVEQGPTTLLAWSEHGLHFALVGELSRTELIKIAASVVP